MKPSAVIRTRALGIASAVVATASGPKPEKIGTAIAPSFAAGVVAPPPSPGAIGMKSPTVSPPLDPDAARSAAATPSAIRAKLGVVERGALAELGPP